MDLSEEICRAKTMATDRAGNNLELSRLTGPWPSDLCWPVRVQFNYSAVTTQKAAREALLEDGSWCIVPVRGWGESDSSEGISEWYRIRQQLVNHFGPLMVCPKNTGTTRIIKEVARLLYEQWSAMEGIQINVF